ncbi:MAG TPA: cyclic nucleotide-binding domain-containing protein, partial [Thermodesulfovibrionales bacterium]|nr:cyclic nucleotide-binding domain-containing protein [Thermodesulfovibrionales bacterium]
MSPGGELFGVTYRKGEVIFNQGEPGDTMFIIQSGAVEISRFENSHKSVLALLEKGDFFGEMALIDKHPRAATAMAISQSRLIPLTRTSLLERIRHDPGVVIHLLKTLCKRIDNTNRMITEMVDNDESLRTLLDDRQASYKKESTGDTPSVAGTEFEDAAGSHATALAQTTMNFDISPDFCVRIEGGEHVFHQGDPGDCMFIILEG